MAGNWHVSASKDREILSDWMRSLCAELKIDKPAQAFVILQETLHAIRDFLPVDRAIFFSEKLPFIIRCVYFAGWTPGETAQADRDRVTFFDRVGQRFGPELPIQPEDAAKAVFAILRCKLQTDEMTTVEMPSFRDFLKTTVDP